jgi:hypothetical protein
MQSKKGDLPAAPSVQAAAGVLTAALVTLGARHIWHFASIATALWVCSAVDNWLPLFLLVQVQATFSPQCAPMHSRLRSALYRHSHRRAYQHTAPCIGTSPGHKKHGPMMSLQHHAHKRNPSTGQNTRWATTSTDATLRQQQTNTPPMAVGTTTMAARGAWLHSAHHSQA